MSSREIAERTGKQHFHVKRDVEEMLGSLGEDASKFGCIYRDSMNRAQREYLLPKDLTLTLVSGYSIPLRHKIISRWQELEAKVATPALPDFSNPAAAARAWAAEYEQKQIAQQQVQQMLPAARVGELAAKHTRRITEVARKLPGVNSKMTQKDIQGLDQVATEVTCRSSLWSISTVTDRGLRNT